MHILSQEEGTVMMTEEEEEVVVDAPSNVPSSDAQIGLKEKAINLHQGNYLCPLASC